MVLSNTSPEGTIQEIDKSCGETWIETQRCINSLQPSMKLGKNIRFGMKHKSKDMLTIKFMLTPKENARAFDQQSQWHSH